MRSLLQKNMRLALICLCGLGAGHLSFAQETVKVGVLHSLSGTMAISEVTVKNATLLAIDQVNASGGVLGKKIEPVIEDGCFRSGDFLAEGAKADPAR